MTELPILRRTPTFDLGKSVDLLEKLNREFERFSQAKSRKDGADHAFNFMLTAWHMCDWVARDALREVAQGRPMNIFSQTPPNLESAKKEVRRLAKRLCPELEICQSFANASKHAEIRKHTRDLDANATVLLPFEVVSDDDFYKAIRLMAEKSNELHWTWTIEIDGVLKPAVKVFATVHGFWHDFVYDHGLNKI